MLSPDKYKTANLVDLLVACPPGDRVRWAGAIVLRALETGGDCRYRHDEHRLNSASSARAACESMTAAYEALQKTDHPLFLRVMLLMPWEHIVRSTGLPLRVGKVLEVLGDLANPEELAAAVGDVTASGTKAIKKLPLDDVLEEERGPDNAIILGVPPKIRRKLGIKERFVAHDRLETAVRCFRDSSWEANLRVLVPWWLDAIGEKRSEPAVKKLVARAGRAPQKEEAATHVYLLLGLLDWGITHPGHARAEDLLRLGLDGRTGAVRKTAADLAAAMKRTDVLEDIARRDPDKGVKKRAEKLLQDLKLDELF